MRSEHEFFGQVCAALQGIPEVLAMGPGVGLSAFKHYLDKHRPETARQVVGFETADHPSEKQLVVMARSYFLKHDRLSGVPTPG